MTAPVPPDANGLREAVERASQVFGWQHLVKYAGQTDEWMDRTLTAIVLAASEAAPNRLVPCLECRPTSEVEGA